MKKHLLVLFFCLFLVMIGFGITLPVFPFCAERLARAGVRLEGTRNEGSEPVISAAASRVEMRVIRTDEEVMIAKAVSRVLDGPGQNTHSKE